MQSRRLGTSLGVDCIVAKTCNLDCVYCECGPTTNRTMVRKEYVASSSVIEELRTFIAEKPAIDFITFGGSGEPTLNSNFGEIVRFLKTEFPEYKTALLTNGTLFYLPEVRDAAVSFDCVLPSLDAVSEPVFKAINQPDPSLDIHKVIDGIIAFSKQYTGALWVEVFILPGINDSPEELSRFKETLTRIAPTRAGMRVQLNSLDRPAAYENVAQASIDRLTEIAQLLLPLPVEILSRQAPTTIFPAIGNDFEETLFSALKRRPMTLEEIAVLTRTTINRSSAVLQSLCREGRLFSHNVNGRVFYKAVA